MYSATMMAAVSNLMSFLWLTVKHGPQHDDRNMVALCCGRQGVAALTGERGGWDGGRDGDGWTGCLGRQRIAVAKAVIHDQSANESAVK